YDNTLTVATRFIMMTLQDHSDRMYTAVMEVGQHTHYGTLPTDHYTGTRLLLLCL
ncbi:hypothetical protein J6590_088369, partial [Homalodisca vitripennis]